MRYGTTQPYIGAAGQIAAGIITQDKLSPVITNVKARAFRSAAAQAIAAITYTKVQLNGETFDIASMYDNVTNYRFTIAAGYAGFYLIAANISVYGDAVGGWARAAIYKNGAVVAIGVQGYPAGAPIASIHVEDYLSLAGGDYVEIWIYLDTAGQVSSGTMYTWADFLRIF